MLRGTDICDVMENKEKERPLWEAQGGKPVTNARLKVWNDRRLVKWTWDLILFPEFWQNISWDISALHNEITFSFFNNYIWVIRVKK